MCDLCYRNGVNVTTYVDWVCLSNSNILLSTLRMKMMSSQNCPRVKVLAFKWFAWKVLPKYYKINNMPQNTIYFYAIYYVYLLCSVQLYLVLKLYLLKMVMQITIVLKGHF